MKDKSAGEMLSATMKTLKNQGVKTMTYDNGTENANHSLVNKLLNCQSFFLQRIPQLGKGFDRKSQQNSATIFSERNELRLDFR